MDSPECAVEWRTIHHWGLTVKSQGNALDKQMAGHFALRVGKKPGTFVTALSQTTITWELLKTARGKNGLWFVFAPSFSLVFGEDSKSLLHGVVAKPGADKYVTSLHKFI